MTLKEHIDDIQKRLEQKDFSSEAAVRQGIIDRLLNALEWPTFDIKVVFPEYGVDKGNVDYALCHPISTPRVFIEVKRVGNIDKGTEQLFDYAYRIGVTILILTDGEKWRFYHPAGEGSYEDRMVVEVNFIVGNSEESAKYLDRYLNYESVKSGMAAKAIAEDYRNIVSLRQIEERLPEVWSELLQEENEYLLVAMMEKAKDKVGQVPTEEQILNFLKTLSSPPVKKKTIKVPVDRKSHERKNKPPKRLRVKMKNGEIIELEDGIETFVEVIDKIGIERVKELNITRNSIPLISTSKDDEREQHKRGEYYIVSGLSSKNKERTLNLIAEELKIDLTVELVDKE
ncbi:type I restriction enzyme HsdR N-terminal domain-containing protein [Candidatus Poribacteria bacterium]|nr:type I restriction enzyme HsdR N-terminal domain-containing protein [Candidatus Poribacteria bacterium]